MKICHICECCGDLVKTTSADEESDLPGLTAKDGADIMNSLASSGVVCIDTLCEDCRAELGYGDSWGIWGPPTAPTIH